MSESIHILLVDDEEAQRYSMCRLLEQAGYRVTSVPDFREALKVLNSSERCDLMITDLVMPDRVNGFALARMARMRRPKLKVLYITGFDVPSDEADGKVLRRPVPDQAFMDEVKLALAA